MHSILDNPKKRRVTIGSFDIGIKNFAQYVEKCSARVLREMRHDYISLPKDKQRRVTGKMNSKIASLIKKTFMCGKTVHMSVTDLSSVCQPDPPYDEECRKNVVTHLVKHKKLWVACDVFVVEQQYFSTFSFKGRRGGGGEANIKAIKVAETLMTWLTVHYPDKPIVSYGSHYKTQVLGAPTSLTKPQRKAWSVKKAKEMFSERGDVKAIAVLDACKKKKQKADDVCDAALQCQSFKFRVFVGRF